MSIEIRRLGEMAGAEILGLDFNHPLDDETVETVNRAFLDHHVVCIRDLDISLDSPEFFYVSGPYSSNWETKWEMKLTRNGASSGYGRYTVVFDQDGFNTRKSSIPNDLAPAQ